MKDWHYEAIGYSLSGILLIISLVFLVRAMEKQDEMIMKHLINKQSISTK